MKKKKTKSHSKRKNVRLSYLKKLEVQITDKGFVIWAIDPKKIAGKVINIKHWVVDASCLKEDGVLRFGNEIYKTEARIELETNQVRISRKRI